MHKPVIGITLDNLDNTRVSGRYDVGVGYAEAVAAGGGTPITLPHEIDRVADYAALCDGFVFTGGVDPDTTAFGQAIHPKARVMDPTRQAFELALFDAIARTRPDVPVLGVCLGMQFMALRAGGALHQYLPDTHDAAVVTRHRDGDHMVAIESDNAGLPTGMGTVHSHHQQAVADAGSMRVVGRAGDGIIEAIDNPSHRFYLGVQWHPERGDAGPLNRGLFKRLVDAACVRP